MSANENSNANSNTKGKGRRFYKALLSWIILLVVLGLIALKVLAGSDVTWEVILLVVLLFAVLVYDEARELSIGSLFTFRRELTQVRETQEVLSRELTQLRLGIKLSQVVSVNTQQALPGLDLKEIVSKQTELELVKKEKEELVQRVDLQEAYIRELKSQYTDQEQLLKHLLGRATFYAIEYYNYSLVANTKNLLAWLGQKTRVTDGQIHDQMNLMGIPAANQVITLDVLLEARMVEHDQETTTYSITSFGRLFLDVKNIKYTDPALLQAFLALLAEEGYTK